MPPVETINWLTGAGLATTLLFVLGLGMAKKWRWGYQFDELKAFYDDQLKAAAEREASAYRARDKWERRALRLLNVVETDVETTRAVIQRVEG